jgi:membrane-associated phospholipid phosphatase
MSENSVPRVGDGIGTGVLSLFVGLPVALLFNAFVQGQDAVVLLLALVGFGGCVLYGEVNVSMPNGVAFGIGMLLTALMSQDGWPIGLGIIAVVVSLARYAFTTPEEIELETEDLRDPVEDRE